MKAGRECCRVQPKQHFSLTNVVKKFDLTKELVKDRKKEA